MAKEVRSANNEQLLQEIQSHRKDNEQQFQSMNAVLQQSERKYLDQLREISSRQEKHITQLMDVNRQQTENIKELTESMFQLYNSKSTTTERQMQRAVSSMGQTSTEEQTRKLVTKTFQRLETNIKQRSGRDDVIRQMLVDRDLEIKKLRRQLEDSEGQLENYKVVIKATNDRLQEEQRPKTIKDQRRTTDAEYKPSVEHLTRIRRLKTLPEPLFSASCVAADMFQCGALTLKELEKIRTSRGDIEAAETLLDILEKAPREVFDCFLQALRHTKQDHVYQQIINQELSANSEHCRLIRNNYLYLVDKLDTKHSLLTVHLYDSEVLSLREKEDIEAVFTSTRQNEKLLSVLSRKSAEQWELFLTALDNTGQWHIVNTLTGRTDTGSYSTTDPVVVEEKVEFEVAMCVKLKQELEQKQQELEEIKESFRKVCQYLYTMTSKFQAEMRLRKDNETKNRNIILRAAECASQLKAMKLHLTTMKQTSLGDFNKLKADIGVIRQHWTETGKELETAIREREKQLVAAVNKQNEDRPGLKQKLESRQSCGGLLAGANVRDERPVRELNMLLLGETGVGKSTWINGLANYFSYETLTEALKGGGRCLIPTTYTMTDENFQELEINWGEVDANEKQCRGQSTTQFARTYTFHTMDTVLRIIDTPGIGDVRGIEQDKKKMQDILSHLSQYKELHGICILLKPNNARLTFMFEFCIGELLTHLHKDACRNIVICFTNARSSFYKPGDTMPALQMLFASKTRYEIKLSKETVYCVDNEAVRFIGSINNGVEFDDTEFSNFEASWKISAVETLRLIGHVAGLEPVETRVASALANREKTVELKNKSVFDRLRRDGQLPKKV